MKKLMMETKKENQICREEQLKGRDDGWYVPDVWKWANMPIENETFNLVKDLELLVAKEKYEIAECIGLGITPYLSLSEITIIESHIQDRIATYRNN